MRKLTKLSIAEVSSVDHGAGEGCEILLRKRADTIDTATEQLAEYLSDILSDPYCDKPAALSKLFESFGDYLKSNITGKMAKADVDDPLRGPRDEDDSNKLSDRLKELVAVMIAANPNHLHPNRAMRHLLHTPQGRELLNLTISKQEKGKPMNRSDELRDIAKATGGMEMICKNIIDRGETTISEHEFSAALMEHAKTVRKADESVPAAFARIFETDSDIRTAYGIAKGYTPNVTSTTPTSVGVGSSETSDDSAEAVRLLREMAEKQHRTFEQVFQDSANAKLAARTYPRRDPNWHSAATVA
jgi:hypothetical protein